MKKFFLDHSEEVVGIVVGFILLLIGVGFFLFLLNVSEPVVYEELKPEMVFTLSSCPACKLLKKEMPELFFVDVEANEELVLEIVEKKEISLGDIQVPFLWTGSDMIVGIKNIKEFYGR